MNWLALVLFSVVFTISGCMSSSSKLDLPEIPHSANPSEELSKLDNKLKKAKQAQVDVYAPTWFQRATESFQNAKEVHQDGGKAKDLFDYLSAGHGQLDMAQDKAEVSKASLKDITIVRELALKAGATKLTAGFEDAEELYWEMASAVEDGLVGYVDKNRKELMANYRAVELEAIKDRALNPARRTIVQAEDEWDGDKYAPQALTKAKSMLEKADQFITANRYKEQKIDEAAARALFFAERAKNLAQYARFVDESEPEDIAYWVEKHVTKSTKYLDQDLRDLPLEAQFSQLAKNIDGWRGTKASLVGQSEKLQLQLEKLKAQQEEEKLKMMELTEEREFNQKFLKARMYFSDDEAEVYKEGGRLVIRLKGIRFPSGKAVLMTKNYPLLSKVKGTLKEFESAKVVVEGHTDSVGSEEVNKRLSSERAHSVKEYLVANEAISQEQIQSVGLGFSRPIASNKTREGREQNRRIDIIIEPE